ncbi:MAG: hypothetical protein PHI05_02205 [Bacilli bacterium]|nr:hypothetical protein [Bacilli bacterium]
MEKKLRKVDYDKPINDWLHSLSYLELNIILEKSKNEHICHLARKIVNTEYPNVDSMTKMYIKKLVKSKIKK